MLLKCDEYLQPMSDDGIPNEPNALPVNPKKAFPMMQKQHLQQWLTT